MLTFLFIWVTINSSCFSGEELQDEFEPFSPALMMRAEAGDSEAQFLVARYYRRGEGVEKNEREAIRWFMASALQGHPRSMNTLGDYFKKNKVESPETDAEIKKATPEMSFSKAKWKKDRPHHLEMAVYWFMKSAEAGNPRAKVQIGLLYWDGLGLEQNDAEAFRWFKEGADEGAWSGLRNLALCYFDGRGCKKDLKKAFDLVYKAAKQKPINLEQKEILANSKAILGNYYYYGWGVEKNVSTAIELWNSAAEAGDGDALAQMGWLFHEGKHVRQDYEKAFEFYSKAVKKENPSAQNNLADLYVDGLGVTKNYSEAYRLYFLSALQTNIIAYTNLGLCYAFGRGVKQDYSEALKWYYKGAQAGDAAAQYNLAELYRTGAGVEKNLNLAREWYQSAADQGCEKSKEALKTISPKR